MREARRALLNGKDKHNYRLDDDQIAALDAIGFKWDDSTVASHDARFFIKVDELNIYKQKHGHLTVRQKEDQSLHDFCCNMRRSRRAIILGKGTRSKLTDERIAALDAIGFDWEVGASSSVNKDFFSRVAELKAYKKKHGHLNVRENDSPSLSRFCHNLRGTRRAIITGKGKIHYSLSDCRIAALDAIGFDWKLGAGATSTVKVTHGAKVSEGKPQGKG